MRAADQITASILIALGALVLLDAVRLGIGWGTDGPKSGFFPFWLALIMIATCAVIIVQESRKKTRRDFVTRERLGAGPQSLVARRHGGGGDALYRPLCRCGALPGFLHALGRTPSVEHWL